MSISSSDGCNIDKVMITIRTQLSYNQLLEAVSQLSPAELDRLQKQLMQLRANQRGTSLLKAEADLLVSINSIATPPSDERYQELSAKRKAETLTGTEYQELITLSNKYEQQTAKCIEMLSQLAQLRGISLSELIDRLTIS